MAVLLQIKDACKSYGDQALLDHAEATLTDDGKIGFVGRNGAGKSTLLRILLDEEELDRGEIIRHPRLRLGYLRQHDPFLPGETTLEFLMRDSEQPDWKCGQIAGRFEIKTSALNSRVTLLSGGWQTRVKLASVLLHEPNLLLLDEPTNFLDLRTQLLLEHFLREYKEACLIVSHDRAFLRATCDQTLDLSRGKLTTFPGRIDAFLEFQRERREHDERTNAAILAKRRHLEEFIAKNRARASTATRAKSKSKQLEKLDVLALENDEPTAKIRAPVVSPRQGVALRCRDLSIGYPERTVAADISVEINHGARTAIVGDNGQGKTTLLRSLVDSLPPLSGDVRWGYGCQLGIYAQHVYTSLPEEKSVLDYLEYHAAPGTKTQQILDTAGAMLFRGEQVKKRIAVLSGGERARACLAGLLLSQHNVLVLDEPGNHLDVDTIEALAEALLEYQGTVLFTSHDRHFMRRVATSVLEVRDGRVINHHGDYEAYLYTINKEVDESEREMAAHGPPSAAPPKKGRPKPHGGPSGEKELRKEMSSVEKKIAQLERQRKTAHEQLMQATDPAEALRLHTEYADLDAQITALEERWLVLQEALGS